MSSRFNALMHHRIFRLFFGNTLIICLSLAVARYIPGGVDWYSTFRPATQALLSGNSPYQGLQAPFAGAPWGLIPLIPFAILPEHIGRGFFFVASIIAFAYVAYRFKATLLTMTAFLLSPPILHCLLNSNLDWLPLLGYVLPPQIGLFFLAVKPQMGSVVCIFWLVEAWRKGKWKEVLRVFSPVMIAFALSLAFYGLWPLNMLKVSQHTQWWEASMWPISIPIGLALAAAALRSRNIKFAIAASPCLSTHVVFHSWSCVLLSTLEYTGDALMAVVGLWILVIIRSGLDIGL